MNIIHEIASGCHEDWRKKRLLEDGTYEPRWKRVKDEEFLKTLDKENLPKNYRVNEKGEVEIDIANSTYDELSPCWQAENKANAEVVAEIIESGELLTYEEIGDRIHTAWLARNPWAKDNPVLSKPFAELPEEEQKKDMDPYYIGLEVVKNASKDNSQNNNDIESE